MRELITFCKPSENRGSATITKAALYASNLVSSTLELCNLSYLKSNAVLVMQLGIDDDRILTHSSAIDKDAFERISADVTDAQDARYP